MAAHQALSQLKASAGERVDEAFLLLFKLFDNIKKNPGEAKFRRINCSSARIQSQLLCFAGSHEFLEAAGFVKETDAGGSAVFVLPASATISFSDGHVALRRTYALISEAKQRSAVKEEVKETSFDEHVKEVLDKSVRGAGRAEVEALARTEEGRAALQVLQKVLANLLRSPQSAEYRSVRLAGKAGQKLRPALPVLAMVGFESKLLKGSNGEEECVELAKVDVDVVERFKAMVVWALSDAPVDLPRAPGSMQHALGAMLGAAVGDAIGTALEMAILHMPVTSQELDKALEMCGGGKWGVAPGQVTDDTEMQIMLAEGLASACSAEAGFPREEVARRYHEWGASIPFDIGMTTRQAVWARSSDAGAMEHRAWEMNSSSQANGALMRCMPLGVWSFARKLGPDAIAEVARADAKLTHPNHSVGSANAAYLIAVTHLIQTCGDRTGALGAVDAWKKQELDRQSPGSEDLAAWLDEALGSEPLAFGPKCAWARIAFSHAFRQLALGSDFETAIRAAIVGGGDTDTNAAIVGGLVGAAVGLGGLPERWVRGVLSADLDLGTCPRQERFHPRRLPALAQQILGSAGAA